MLRSLVLLGSSCREDMIPTLTQGLASSICTFAPKYFIPSHIQSAVYLGPIFRINHQYARPCHFSNHTSTLRRAQSLAVNHPSGLSS